MLKNEKNRGITLIALIVTIIVLLILAAVSIQMLTGDNGIITNASKVSTSNAYYSAEEQVKLTYMAVKAEISAKTVKSGTYDPTVASETTALATIVANDLGANQTGSKWAVDGSTAGTIKITYTDSKIDKDSIGTVNLATMDGTTVPTVVPTEEGIVHYKIKLLASQDAKLYTDVGVGETASEILERVPAMDARIANAENAEELAAAKAEKIAYYQSIYGSVVNYGKIIDTSLNNCWKIFYIGTMGDDTENHIYLIADSYINNSTNDFPTKIIGDTTYSYNKNGTWKEFFGWNTSSGIHRAYTTGIIGSSYATVNEIKKLNYKYFFVGNYTGENHSNMRCVASMLDTNIWVSYMDSTTNGKAKYAIGGPTIEMLFKSYNQTHGTNLGEKVISEAGYKINIEDNATTGWTNNITSVLNTTDTNRLYVSDIETIYATAYWLASSAADSYGDFGILCVNNCGDVSYSSFSDSNFGFRPIVCLKSNVQLEEMPDGTYELR